MISPAAPLKENNIVIQATMITECHHLQDERKFVTCNVEVPSRGNFQYPTHRMLGCLELNVPNFQ